MSQMKKITKDGDTKRRMSAITRPAEAAGKPNSSTFERSSQSSPHSTGTSPMKQQENGKLSHMQLQIKKDEETKRRMSALMGPVEAAVKPNSPTQLVAARSPSSDSSDKKPSPVPFFHATSGISKRETDDEIKRRVSVTRKSMEPVVKATPPRHLAAPPTPRASPQESVQQPWDKKPSPKQMHGSPLPPSSDKLIMPSPSSAASRESVTVAFPKARMTTPPGSPSSRRSPLPLLPTTKEMEHRAFGDRKQRVSLPPHATSSPQRRSSSPHALVPLQPPLKYRLGERREHRASLPPSLPGALSAESPVRARLGDRRQQRSPLPLALPGAHASRDSPVRHNLGDSKQPRASLPPSLPGARVTDSPVRHGLGDSKLPRGSLPPSLPGAYASSEAPVRHGLGDSKQPRASLAPSLPIARSSDSPNRHRLGARRQRVSMPASELAQHAAQVSAAFDLAQNRRQLGVRKANRLSLPNGVSMAAMHQRRPSSSSLFISEEEKQELSAAFSTSFESVPSANLDDGSIEIDPWNSGEEQQIFVPSIAGPGAFFVPADAVPSNEIEPRTHVRRPSGASTASTVHESSQELEIPNNNNNNSLIRSEVDIEDGREVELEATALTGVAQENTSVAVASGLSERGIPSRESPRRSPRRSVRRTEVVDDHEDDNDHDHIKPKKKRCCYLNPLWWCNVIAPLILAGVVVAVVILVVKSFKESSQAHKKEVPTAPTPAPVLQLFGQGGLAPNFTHNALEDLNSPQAKAKDWLMGDPNARTYTHARKMQRFALVTLYHALNGARWTNSTHWLSYDHHECLWFTARVQPQETLNLTGPETGNGTSAANGMACNQNLEYEYLYLASNSVGGMLPPEISLLTSLVEVNLESNRVNGPIPTEVGTLTRLAQIVLSQNEVEGGIPTEIGLLARSLTKIDLRDNKLTGVVATELAKLNRLVELDLTGNLLSSSIPASFGQLENVQILRFENNQLTGHIPSELGGLTQLYALNVGGNRLTGSIPSEIASLTQLEYLSVSSNSLDSVIPKELANLPMLRAFLAVGSGIRGTIPGELGRMTSLAALLLGQNHLTGPIPRSLGQLTNMQQLEFWDNRVTGTLPRELGSLSLLEILHGYATEIVSSVPSEFGRLTGLTELMLFDTLLSGPIPTQLGNLSNLEQLAIQNTKLSGSFPAVTCSLVASRQLTISADCKSMVCCAA